jgi:hypothetical protein
VALARSLTDAYPEGYSTPSMCPGLCLGAAGFGGFMGGARRRRRRGGDRSRRNTETDVARGFEGKRAVGGGANIRRKGGRRGGDNRGSFLLLLLLLLLLFFLFFFFCSGLNVGTDECVRESVGTIFMDCYLPTWR